MKEYYFENGHSIDISKLRTPLIRPGNYKYIHERIVRPCHDVFIEYHGGILLVLRKRFPVKDIFWAIGGGIKRGMPTEDSLRKKVKEECNLELEDIKKIGCARTFFETDPLGHGKGTDTINFVYFARGKGKLKLDNLHASPTIITPEQYTEEFKKGLHPYIRDFMDLAISLM